MSRPKVLVVDDSRTVRFLVTRTLEDEGYQTSVACDGREALEAVTGELPDLAILDIQMPFLDGYGVCQSLQEMGAPYSEIPIIFLTTLDSNALELLGDELGAYLQKPVRPKLLMESVTRFLPSAAADSVTRKD